MGLYFFIKSLFLALACTGTLYYVLSTLALAARLRECRGRTPGDAAGPLVSVLKPVCGVDADAEANLKSFLCQDYGNYEVLFGVLEENDESLDLLSGIVDDSPCASLYIGSGADGSNNKVRILTNLAQKCRGEIILVADADTKVRADWIRTMLGPFRESAVGANTCMYRGINARTAADALEGLHMTCTFAPGVASSRYLQGMKFALGAATAVRREALDTIGGFRALADYLADDYQLGLRIANAGYCVCLSEYVVDIALSGESLGHVLKRELRWSRTTRVSRPGGHFGLVFTFGTAFSALFLAASGFSLFGWSVLVSAMAIRSFTAYLGASRYLGDREFVRRIHLLPARDLLSFAVWVAGFFSNTVTWRGRKLHLRTDGTMKVG